MKQVFQLSIQFGKINTDLYFEGRETAENTAAFLKKMAKENTKDQLKISASIHQVLSKEAVAENLKNGLWLSLFSGKN
jgi:mannitol/fructose-specific phosphotransferase system IIA component (Ntr-type)